ncbi:aromatic amino acid transaminase [Leucothrix mucor]|uniref:aromatic amino acid transaminase n=1 Tax=Leucothrix mucor TaxID=45248 RepID=UPI0003B3E832|nr:aromatic amino acid transaminase [Leucothrix mucor]
MLDHLPHLQGDPLWALADQFKADTRDEKIDLIVGVYRDESGQTPVMQTVQAAERFLAEQAMSKSYKLLSGNMTFNNQIAEFLLGDSPRLEEQCTIQTVGGSGALRVLADLIAQLSPNSVVWNTEPGYINHRPIMEGAGLRVSPFRWQDKAGQLDIETCFADLVNAVEGDVLLLHGSCHNPSGIDPSLAQWQQFADFCKRKKVTPFIDMAYQGFGDGPDEDAAGLRLLVDQIDVVLLASSCSKNMGLYCERTGAATVITKNKAQHKDLRTLLERITRANYSMPPNHGSAIASMLFDDPEPWLEELSVYRDRVANNRQELGRILSELGAPASLNAIAQQKGMFSLLPLSAEQMLVLRDEFAIYGLPNGRINIAGLRQSQIRTLAEALVYVTK